MLSKACMVTGAERKGEHTFSTFTEAETKNRTGREATTPQANPSSCSSHSRTEPPAGPIAFQTAPTAKDQFLKHSIL